MDEPEPEKLKPDIVEWALVVALLVIDGTAVITTGLKPGSFASMIVVVLLAGAVTCGVAVVYRRYRRARLKLRGKM